MGHTSIQSSGLSANRGSDRVGCACSSSESLAGFLAGNFCHIAAGCLDSILLDFWCIVGMVRFAVANTDHAFAFPAAALSHFEFLAAKKRRKSWVCINETVIPLDRKILKAQN